MEVIWSEIKRLSNERGIPINWVISGDNYILRLVDGSLVVECYLPKNSLNENTLDFETNFKSKGTVRNTVSLSAFSSSETYRFRGNSFVSTITAGQTKNIDYKIEEDRWINAGFLVLKNHNFGDNYTFQVVDIDNILGSGLNVVLDQFITNFYVVSDSELQPLINTDYPAKILKDLYIRVIYVSTGELDVNLKCNLYLHKKI